MTPPDAQSDKQIPDAVDRAVDLFLGHTAGPRSEAGEAVRQKVERVWQAVGNYADSPELMALREQALARARKANARRWKLPASSAHGRWLAAAAVAAIAILAGVVWQLSSYGFAPGVYQTGIGDRKVVELDDRSMVTLDANTRLHVRYSANARIIEITEGQAQFSVAKDPTRPFKVIAGEHTIVALGTVFTVEYIERKMQIAMLEGRVAVYTPPAPQTNKKDIPIELAAGEALQLHPGNSAKITAHADLAAATAWRQGQVIFHNEPLAEAVSRLNRYSRVQLKVVDPELAQLSISGLFDAGDSRAFANALQSYLPIVADDSNPETIELKMK